MPRRPLLPLVLLALALAAALGGGARAQALDWRATLAQSASETPAVSAADLKRRVPPALAPRVAPPLTAATVAAIAADAETRYPDGERPLGRAATTALFGNDLAALVGAQALLESGGDPALVTAAADLLQSDRRLVRTMLGDVRRLAPASASLEAGTRFLEQANAAWARGEPVNAVQHLEQAAARAWDALDALGVRYAVAADLDRDGVPDILELRAGSDPRLADTDADGLTDAFELGLAKRLHDPAKADTDGDGLPDRDEDLDSDGLTAKAEQTAGSNPLAADTDRDGLADGLEVLTHGTSPTRADTDSDGLADAVELRAGTDPTRPDTDGDGILDGLETTTQTVAKGPVRVALTGVGDVSSGLEIAPLAGDALLSAAPGQAGPAYDLTVPPGTQLERARITLAYDPARAGGDEADLRLFWFDPAKGFWQPAADAQAVDTAANTVTAEVDHLSIYAIFNVRNWNATLTGLAGTCEKRDGGGDVVYVDVAFVLDSSGSMSWNDPEGFRKLASKQFVDALLAQDRGAVVDFDSFATILQGLTSDKTLLKAAIDRIDDVGGTSIAAGVSAGLTALAPSTDPARAKLMILLTDGVGTWNPALITAATTARVTIYTIGLGFEVDTPLLQSIATQTGGRYFSVATASDLPDVFREIEEETGDSGKDTDEDGLTDCEEEKGVRDAAGFLTFTSDPRVADTDGDGLTDGEEVHVSERFKPAGSEAFLYPVFSDPRQADTDGDGLSDPEEADAGSRARSNETDGDGLGDLRELELGSDPTDVDTDRDGYLDGYEDLNRSGGYDPLLPTEVLGTLDYIGQFLMGATCGELLGVFGLCQGDTVAWLAGNIASGFVGVGDIRDAIGLLFQGDLVGAGLSVFSVIPIAGDAASVVAKVVKFVRRVSAKAGDALKTVLRSDLPQWAKLRILDDVAGGATSRMRGLGVTDDALERLGRSGMDLRLLEGAMDGAARVVRSGFVDWRTAETLLGGAKKGFATVPGLKGTTGYRFVDGWDAATRIAREAKTGFADLTPFVQRQIDKDVLLRARGEFAGVEWHFFASSASDTLGPSTRLLDELRAKGIPYVIHLP